MTLDEIKACLQAGDFQIARVRLGTVREATRRVAKAKRGASLL
jgi:hypothetical protein